MAWNHIKFEDGSNPYICKTDKELERISGVQTGKWSKYTKEELKAL